MASTTPRRPPVAGSHDLLPAVGWVCVVVVAALQVAGAFRRPAVDLLADLHVYWASVRLLLDGGSLYDFAAHNGAPFTYPPIAGVLFAPLGLIPEPTLRLGWTVATVVVVLLIAGLVRRYAPLAREQSSPVTLPLLALLLFASAPISSNLRFGQISVFLVAAVLADGLGVVPQRYRGLATGVAAAVKLTPAIFIPYWWLTGQRRTAATAAAGFAGATLLGWLILPGESIRFWLTEIWNVDRVGNIATGGNQSLNGALLRLDLPDPVRAACVVCIGGLVVVAALARAVRMDQAGEPFTGLVIVGAAGLVLSPVSWTHHQVWLVLAALLAVGPSTRWKAVWAATVVVIMVLPVTAVGAGGATASLTGNARLLLAVTVACLIPFRPATPREQSTVRPLAVNGVP